MLPRPGSVFDDLDFCARLVAPTAMVLEEPLEEHVLKSFYAKQNALNTAISTVSAKGHYEEEVQREIEAIDAIGDYRARSSVGARLPDDRMLSERKEFLESDQRKILTRAYDLAMSSTIPNYVQTLNYASAYFYELTAAHRVAEKAREKKMDQFLKRQREEEERQNQEELKESLMSGRIHYRSLDDE